MRERIGWSLAPIAGPQSISTRNLARDAEQAQEAIDRLKDDFKR
jgi:hypothetical protein